MAEKKNRLMKELKRRGVIQALAAYTVIVWVLAEGLVDLLPAIGFPDWTIRLFLLGGVAGTPLVAFLAWRFNITFKGILRDPRDVPRPPRDSVTRGSSPTRKSTHREETGVGTVLATWRTTAGELREEEFHSEFVVGRDFRADVRMNDDRVSRRHLRVYPVDNVWHVRDLDSLNGSYVDGKSIDVIKLDPEADVSLDKNGPKIHFTVRVADETVQTARTANTRR